MSDAHDPRQARTDPGLARRIARYYDDVQVLYTHIWSRRGVHYGLWDAGTRSREEATRNLDLAVGRLLALPPGSRVLDAGCGVGGTSTHLAREHGHRVLGITLSRHQLTKARGYAAESAPGPPPRYEIRDFLATGLAAESFDGVIALESSCYAEPKLAFLREAYRLLRPGGRLVVADGFLGRPLRAGERAGYRRFLDGFALEGLAALEDFEADLWKAGFARVERLERQAAVMPSARRIEVLSWLGLALIAAPCALRLLPRTWLGHGLSGVSQRRLLARGAIRYCLFVARKAPGDVLPPLREPAGLRGPRGG